MTDSRAGSAADIFIPGTDISYEDIYGGSAFHDFIGCETPVFSPEEKTVQLAMPVKPEYINAVGIVHGGIISTLLDISCGVVRLMYYPPGRRKWATVTLNTHYIAASQAKRLVAVGRMKKPGRATFFSEAELFDENGKLLASANATFAYVGDRLTQPAHA